MTTTQPPTTLATLVFSCLICNFSFPSRNFLLEHLHSASDDYHKPCMLRACLFTFYPHLVAQGVLTCPRGCGAFFNGGDTGFSKPLEAHL
jgi:hypothetical protein